MTARVDFRISRLEGLLDGNLLALFLVFEACASLLPPCVNGVWTCRFLFGLLGKCITSSFLHESASFLRGVDRFAGRGDDIFPLTLDDTPARDVELAFQFTFDFGGA